MSQVPLPCLLEPCLHMLLDLVNAGGTSFSFLQLTLNTDQPYVHI